MSGAIDKLKEQSGLVKKPKTIMQLLEEFKPQVALAIPKHLTPERVIRIAVTALRNNPQLQQCDPQTILSSVMLASQLGLEIGVLGQAYLVPYKQTCQMIPGWKGFVDLVNRAGRAGVWTGAVYPGDEFDWGLGDKPFVHHKPSGESGEESDAFTHVYAVGRVKGMEWPVVEVWTAPRIWKHRDRYNKVGERHYSYKNQEMYARKVPLLQVVKYLPVSVEMATAVNLDNQAEIGMQRYKIDDVKGVLEGMVEPQEREPGCDDEGVEVSNCTKHGKYITPNCEKCEKGE